ncbi:MAG: thiosulfate sulfurtransferase [Alphaproteobacteria bacterium]|nr:thiosulfate sulfurtransferase [Alphaproteobacteria bacterium]
MTNQISPADLRTWLLDEDELALLDVREEGVFGADGHLLFAVCLPMSRLELDILSLVPRKSVRLVLCDGGDGLAERAATKISDWGYTNISILTGGVSGWEAAGNVVFRGVNVPSKAFGEFVEIESDTPNVSAEELNAMMDRGENMVVLDSRPWVEYRRMNIPTGIDCPGAELAYRVHDIVDDPERIVVVNCAGRTRSIIGAQSLINAGITNKVMALRNGTMGWALAGFDLETGSDRNFLPVSDDGLQDAHACAERVATRFGVQTIDHAMLENWQAETETKSLYLLDVRNPDEYAAGHLPGSLSAPGGQLVQATDKWAGTYRSRLVLIDDTGVRATMTASWLIQMGWPNVFVLKRGLENTELESGAQQAPVVPVENEVELISADELRQQLDAGTATVVDVATSLEYKAAHVSDAWWVVRSRLGESLAAIAGEGPLVFTSPDGVLASYAASDAAMLTDRPVRLLDGGTVAWQAAGLAVTQGFENMADQNNDIQYKAYDHDDNIEFHMQEYLSWETGLVEQVERDGTARFKHFPI